MAFWNAPDRVPRYNHCSVMAAVRCQERLKVLHQKWKEARLPQLRCRVGMCQVHSIPNHFLGTHRHERNLNGRFFRDIPREFFSLSDYNQPFSVLHIALGRRITH